MGYRRTGLGVDLSSALTTITKAAQPGQTLTAADVASKYSTLFPTSNNLVELATTSVQNVIHNTGVLNNLSPPAKMAAVTLYTVIDQTVGFTSLASMAIQQAQPILETVLAVARNTGVDLIYELFGAGGGEIGDMFSDLSTSVPLFGALLKLILNPPVPWGTSAAGQNPWCASLDAFRDHCLNANAQNVITSGPNNTIVPCDLFNGFLRADGVTYTPYFVGCTNPNNTWVPSRSVFADPYMASPPSSVSCFWNSSKWQGGATTGPFFENMPDVGWAFYAVEGYPGIPGVNVPGLTGAITPLFDSSTRLILQKLRQTIKASYQQGDGGATLWPIYVDIILRQLDNGNTTDAKIWQAYRAWNYAQAGGIQCGSNVSPDVAQYTCADVAPGGKAMFDAILDGWRKTIYSPYVQNQLATLTEAQIEAKAKAALQKKAPIVLKNLKDLNPGPKLAALNLTLVNQQIAANKPMSTGTKVVLGGGALAALLWFFL